MSGWKPTISLIHPPTLHVYVLNMLNTEGVIFNEYEIEGSLYLPCIWHCIAHTRDKHFVDFVVLELLWCMLMMFLGMPSLRLPGLTHIVRTVTGSVWTRTQCGHTSLHGRSLHAGHWSVTCLSGKQCSQTRVPSTRLVSWNRHTTSTCAVVPL